MVKKYYLLSYLLLIIQISIALIVFNATLRFFSLNSVLENQSGINIVLNSKLPGLFHILIIALVFDFLTIILNLSILFLFLKIDKDKDYNDLKIMALTDSLTGLYNRRYFDNFYENIFAQSSRYNMPLSLIMCDIDHFKNINDTFGHDRGDDILKMVSNVLKDNVRKSDMVARFGGEEFVICLPSTAITDAIDVAKKLNQMIRNIETKDIKKITASLGVVSYRKEFENKPKDLLKKVDSLLYTAKNNGRNRVVSEDSYGDILDMGENILKDEEFSV